MVLAQVGRGMRLVGVIALGALQAFSSPVGAQDASLPSTDLSAPCICTVSPAAGPPGSIATLQDVAGRVLLAGAHGYVQVASGTVLAVGDRALLAHGGRAMLVSEPTCRAQLPSPAQLSVVKRGGRACIAVLALQPTPLPAAGQPLTMLQEALLFSSAAGYSTGFSAFQATRDEAAPQPVSP